MHRIYLDNAATSWPKPPCMVEAIRDFYTKTGSSAGRGNSDGAIEASKILDRGRKLLAQQLGGVESTNIVFTYNATDAINQAIHGFVRPGDHVVSSVTEHNSVVRPLTFLERHHHVELSWLECDPMGRILTDSLPNILKNQAVRLVCLSAVSNVTGVIQPVQEISRICQEHGVAVLIDAAQAMGHLDLAGNQFDFVAASGHKGLLGPQGTGFLYVGPKVAEALHPLRQGGTGSQSESPEQPTEYPYRMESGTANVGGIAGLSAALEFLATQEARDRQRKVGSLTSRIREEFSEIPGLSMYPKFASPVEQTEIVAFNIHALDPQTVCRILDSTFGIQVRSGLHCSPKMHEALKTSGFGGTVRISPGLFTSLDEIEKLVDAVKEIVTAI